MFPPFADKDAKSDNVAELQPLYVELNKQLIELENDPFEKSAFEYFDFAAWVQAKVSGRSFRELIEEKAGVTEELKNKSYRTLFFFIYINDKTDRTFIADQFHFGFQPKLLLHKQQLGNYS